MADEHQGVRAEDVIAFTESAGMPLTDWQRQLIGRRWPSDRVMVPLPAPGWVLMMVSDGEVYAVQEMQREILEDEEAAGPVLAMLLPRMDEKIAGVRRAAAGTRPTVT